MQINSYKLICCTRSPPGTEQIKLVTLDNRRLCLPHTARCRNAVFEVPDLPLPQDQEDAQVEAQEDARHGAVLAVHAAGFYSSNAAVLPVHSVGHAATIAGEPAVQGLALRVRGGVPGRLHRRVPRPPERGSRCLFGPHGREVDVSRGHQSVRVDELTRV